MPTRKAALLTTDSEGSPDARGGYADNYRDLKSREFRCPECNARCTRGTADLEYGHRYDCPNRPDSLPGGGSKA